MSALKYYAVERATYGDMGAVTEKQAIKAIKAVCSQNNVRPVDFTINKKAEEWSWYFAGAGMIGPKRTLSPPLSIPTISMAPAMMVWACVCHELAHHLDYCFFDAKTKAFAWKSGVDVTNRLELGRWMMRCVVPRRTHGKDHKRIMRETVEFLWKENFIKVPPNYKFKGLLDR